MKCTIFSSVRSKAAPDVSLESPHHPAHTGQEMGSIGHVVPNLTLSDFKRVITSVFGCILALNFF
jgi:hypothetical protein